MDEAIGNGTRFRRRPSIIAADVADESVLLDIDSGMFFQLNPSAARIWQLIEQPSSIADLVQAMVARYEVDADTCQADVGTFVAHMQEQGLLERAAAA